MSKSELKRYLSEAEKLTAKRHSVGQLLTLFNGILQRRAKEIDVPVGDIKIGGVQGDDAAKILAIREELTGILERTSVTPKEIPPNTKS